MAAATYQHSHHLVLSLLHPCTSSHPTKSLFLKNYSQTHVRNPLKHKTQIPKMPLAVTFALTESDSTNSLNPDPHTLLLDLADNMDLPPDFFAKLPRDLRLDLNDAAFDLSSGPVLDECGQELGETLLNLGRAWESADTSTSSALAKMLPSLEKSSTAGAKSALGRRLMSAGRRFQSMGQYGQGEVEKIAKSMINAGKLLSATAVPDAAGERPEIEARMFKFGELQVEVTPQKAYIGAAIAVVFGFLSWEVSQGIQNIPENSLQYANDNALLLAKSLRGTLLAVFYTSTLLSGFSAIGLVLLARQLQSDGK